MLPDNIYKHVNKTNYKNKRKKEAQYETKQI